MKKQLMINYKMMKYFIKLSPISLIILLLYSLSSLGIALFSSFMLSIIIESVTIKELATTINVLTLIVGINFLLIFINRLLANLKDNLTSDISQKFRLMINNKIATIKYQNLEDPEFLELKEQVRFALDSQSALYSTFFHISGFIENLIKIISFIALLSIFNYLTIIIIFIGVLITILLNIYGIKVQMNLFSKIIPINRRFSYYEEISNSIDSAKDFRFYPIGDLFVQKYENYAMETKKELIKTNVKIGVFDSLSTIISVTETGFLYGTIAYKNIIKKPISVSAFTLELSSATNLMQATSTIIMNITNLKRLASYCDNIITLLEKEDEKLGTKKIESIKTIEFKNVSFTYPKTDNEILHNLSFKINKGEKISIVGLNGAGKTTIVKLICGMFDVSKGEILVNNLNIKEYDLASYRSLISTVFQDFRLFGITLKENVCLYNNEKDFERALQEVNLKEVVDKLPFKGDSIYGKDLDESGVMLSGGQVQKLAIARALYKSSNLVILDEPTSALDPKAEAQIYEDFNKMVKDKTSIYISHRMSSSIFCDKILVLNNGSLESFAPHSELMKNKDSLYYKLFHLQAQNYKI